MTTDTATRTTPATPTAMAEVGSPALVRLMTLLSPAFPVGAFAYSHGIERAVHDGLVSDRVTLVDWLCDLLAFGSGWNDAVLFASAWTADGDGELAAVAELAEALAGSAERHLEAMAQGGAFLQAVRAWPDAAPPALAARAAYPVAVGATARRLGLDRDAALAAFLNAFVCNLVQAAVRLVPLGQSDGVAAIAALEPAVLSAAGRAAAASLDDLGSATVISDVLSMTHETQTTRLFRS